MPRATATKDQYWQYHNTRPCARGYYTLAVDRGGREGFQFTPLCQGLRALLKTLPKNICFNSRPCARGYFYNPYHFYSHPCFNSCPCARGYDRRKEFITKSISFNSRPCARGYIPLFLTWIVLHVSIHAPVPGATIYR